SRQTRRRTRGGGRPGALAARGPPPGEGGEKPNGTPPPETPPLPFIGTITPRGWWRPMILRDTETYTTPPGLPLRAADEVPTRHRDQHHRSCRRRHLSRLSAHHRLDAGTRPAGQYRHRRCVAGRRLRGQIPFDPGPVCPGD